MLKAQGEGDGTGRTPRAPAEIPLTEPEPYNLRSFYNSVNHILGEEVDVELGQQMVAATNIPRNEEESPASIARVTRHVTNAIRAEMTVDNIEKWAVSLSKRFLIFCAFVALIVLIASIVVMVYGKMRGVSDD